MKCGVVGGKEVEKSLYQESTEERSKGLDSDAMCKK